MTSGADFARGMSARQRAGGLVEHRAGLAAVGRTDDAVVFQLFHKAGGAVETDLEAPLHPRNGRPPLFPHKILHLAVQGILGRISGPPPGAAACGFKPPLRNIYFLGRAELPLPVGHDSLHLLIAETMAVQSLHTSDAGLEQHVAPAQKMLSAHLIKNGARIVLGREL